MCRVATSVINVDNGEISGHVGGLATLIKISGRVSPTLFFIKRHVLCLPTEYKSEITGKGES